MAFFSQQGLPFSQAVGFVPQLGPLRACNDGVLGADCPDCPPCSSSSSENNETGLSLSSQDEEAASSFFTDRPRAWHDGIFSSPEGSEGSLHAFHDGSLGGGTLTAFRNGSLGGSLTAFHNGSLGLPLYVNGRLVTDPITIHHGRLNGLGAALDLSALPLIVDFKDPLALGDFRTLLKFFLSSPFVGGKGLPTYDAFYPEGAVASPGWSAYDSHAVNTIFNSKVFSGTGAAFQKFKTFKLGDQNLPTAPFLYWLMASAAESDTNSASNIAGMENLSNTPFFKVTLPNFMRGAVEAETMQSPAKDSRREELLNIIANTEINWPDGTVTVGDRLVKTGETTKDLKAEGSTNAAAKPNYLLYGGIAVGVVALGYLFRKQLGLSRR